MSEENTQETATPSQDAEASVQSEAPVQGLAEQPQTPEQQQQAKEVEQQTAATVDSAIPDPSADQSLNFPKPDGQETPQPDPTAEDAQAQPERVVPAVDGYALPEGVPQEVGMFANRNDMTQAQLDNVLQFQQHIEANQANAQAEALMQAGKQHLESWGEQAPYKTNLAKRALQHNDPGGKLAEVLKHSGYGNHPAVLEFLHTVGNSMKEGGYLKGNVNTPPGKKSAAQTLYGDTHPSNE